MSDVIDEVSHKPMSLQSGPTLCMYVYM